MFSSGNFKNIVGVADSLSHLDPHESNYNDTIELKIELSKDYAWAAMDETSKNVAELTQLAPTVKHSNKALFVVRVTYYVQATIYFGLLRRPISLKLPFILKRSEKKKEKNSKDKNEDKNENKNENKSENKNENKNEDKNNIEITKSKLPPEDEGLDP